MNFQNGNPAALRALTGSGNTSFLSGDGFEITGNRRALQAPRYEPRFRRQIERIHALGPCVMGYFAEALAAGGDLRATVAEFAELDGNFIKSYRGDQFAPFLRAVDGGAS